LTACPRPPLPPPLSREGRGALRVSRRDFLDNAERKSRLEALLLDFQPLWRPQPFKEETPAWCAHHPALTDALLNLDDEAVDRLGADNAALIGLISQFVPELACLTDLLPLTGQAEADETDSQAKEEVPQRLFTDIPGRKQAQILAYAAALGQPLAPLLEWCAGKGHLGRLLARRWRLPVTSLEIDAQLCEAGTALARQAGVSEEQDFLCADALADSRTYPLHNRHAIALHACGDLHTRLIEQAIARSAPALDIAPCCYYRTAHTPYRPFNATPLVLNHDDLRLAVTETVTASARQRQRSRQALAWKLGWVELRRALTGETAYRTFPPVPEAWLRGTFEDFVRRMCERTALDWPAPLLTPLPPGGGGAGGEGAAPTESVSGKIHPDLNHYEALGHARAARMLRLQLVRLAFRRALEVWLLTDMAVHLEKHGYVVDLQTFCDPQLTPRNLLLSARRYT
jgi:hypothetical protein